MTSINQLDFAVIGAQKCATSWMYYCLADHPDICLPQKKREDKYIGGPLFNAEGEEWFFNRFSRHNEKVVGDVSVDYLYDGASAKTLAKYMPAPKLVVSMRDPVTRFISSYYWLCRCAILPNTDINEWVERLPAASNDWNAELGKDASQVILRGFYSDQLNDYLDHFSREDFSCLLYEEIKSDPLKSIQRVYRFLDVDSSFRPPNLNTRPKQNSHNSFLLFIERTFRSRIASHLANWAHQRLSKVTQKAPPITAKSMRKLEEIFRSQKQATIELLSEFPNENRPSVETIRDLWNIN